MRRWPAPVVDALAPRAAVSFDNNYEFVEFTAPVTGGGYVISVNKPRFDASSEYYALAWTNWVTP